MPFCSLFLEIIAIFPVTEFYHNLPGNAREAREKISLKIPLADWKILPKMTFFRAVRS